MLSSWLKRDKSLAAATTSVENNSPVTSSYLNIDEPSQSTSTSKTTKPLNVSKVYGDTDVFDHSHRNGRHYITCIPCLKHPNINKIYSKTVPAIAQICGTIYREDVKKKHLSHISEGHILCTIPSLKK